MLVYVSLAKDEVLLARAKRADMSLVKYEVVKIACVSIHRLTKGEERIHVSDV